MNIRIPDQLVFAVGFILILIGIYSRQGWLFVFTNFLIFLGLYMMLSSISKLVNDKFVSIFYVVAGIVLSLIGVFLWLNILDFWTGMPLTVMGIYLIVRNLLLALNKLFDKEK